MASSIELPVRGEDIGIIPQSTKTREAKLYDPDAKKLSDVPETLPTGEPLYSFNAVAQAAGAALGLVTVKSPVQELPQLEFGQVMSGAGYGLVKIANQRDGYELRVTIIVGGLTPPQVAGRTKNGD